VESTLTFELAEMGFQWVNLEFGLEDIDLVKKNDPIDTAQQLIPAYLQDFEQLAFRPRFQREW
jgi:hypothetical protein